jgi:hypothetical protein
MTERPFICCDHEVRAILDGRKTQARRIVKPQPVWGVLPDGYGPCWRWQPKSWGSLWVGFSEKNNGQECLNGDCPYGKPGYRLWVRESWYESPMTGECKYKAEGEVIGWRPRPSIHMPRWASRITLEVTGIRCERLQDISVDDCIAEGMDPHPKAHIGPYQEYHNLWESIHGEGSCDENPYVWVVEFKRVTP